MSEQEIEQILIDIRELDPPASSPSVLEAIVEEGSVIAGKKMFHDSPAKTYTQLELKLSNSDIDYAKEITTAKEVYELAKDIFEDENLHTSEGKLFIRFPKLDMTNSNEHKHTIYDMIVRLAIVPQTDRTIKSIVYITGLRTTLSYKEIHSSYRHSHLECGRFGVFTEFCLGSSDFALLRQNVQLHPTIGNWILLLMSLENYLSWESIEGGPYIKMSNIRGADARNIDTTAIITESKRLASIIPEECIDVNEMKIIEGQDFDEFLDHFCRVRKYTTESSFTEEHKRRLEGQFIVPGVHKGIKWKTGELMFKILPEEELPAVPEAPSVDAVLKSQYIREINVLLTNFKTIYNNEWYQQKNPRAYYTLGETNSDRNTTSSRSNRLSSSPRR